MIKINVHKLAHGPELKVKIEVQRIFYFSIEGILDYFIVQVYLVFYIFEIVKLKIGQFKDMLQMPQFYLAYEFKKTISRIKVLQDILKTKQDIFGFRNFL